MGGACSTNGGEEERVYVVGGKARGKETTRRTKTEVVGYRMDLVEVGWGYDWIGLAQDRDRWRDLSSSAQLDGVT
jgi:hypothetical protein